MFKILSGNKKGVLLVEVAIVVAIISIALIGTLTLTVFSLKISVLVKEINIANSLAQETMEAVRNIRDGTDWDSDGLGFLTLGAIYHPEIVMFQWKLLEGQETINGFDRKVIFESVSRSPINDNIELVYNPANYDPDTVKIIVTVSWKDKEIKLINYLSNWK